MVEYLDFVEGLTQLIHGYRAGDPLSALQLYFNAFVLIPALAIASVFGIINLVKDLLDV